MITEFFVLTLITFLLDYVLVWLGENRCWSLYMKKESSSYNDMFKIGCYRHGGKGVQCLKNRLLCTCIKVQRK